MSSRSKLFVLGWHNVVPSWRFTGGRAMFLRGFAAQIATLHRTANVVALEDALTALSEGRPLPPRAVALTFDDGYADAVDVVAPVLLRRRLPATFFVCPGFLDRSSTPAWEVVSWAVRTSHVPSLDWDGRRHPLRTAGDRRNLSRRIAADLKGLDRAHRDAAVTRVVAACRPARRLDLDGLLLDAAGVTRLAELGFSIGSHTVNHPILSRESPSAQREEIGESRTALARLLGREPTVFAYPNGQRADFDRGTMDLVADAGYRYAVTTVFGDNDAAVPAAAVRRVMIDPRLGPAAFISLLQQSARVGSPDVRVSPLPHQEC